MDYINFLCDNAMNKRKKVIISSLALISILMVILVVCVLNSYVQDADPGKKRISSLFGSSVTYKKNVDLLHTKETCLCYEDDRYTYFITDDLSYLPLIQLKDNDTDKNLIMYTNEEDIIKLVEKILPETIGVPQTTVFDLDDKGIFAKVKYMIEEIGTGTEVYLRFADDGKLIECKTYYEPVTSFPLTTDIMPESDAIRNLNNNDEMEKYFRNNPINTSQWGYRSYIKFSDKSVYWCFQIPITDTEQKTYKSIIVREDAHTGKIADINYSKDENSYSNVMDRYAG